MYYKDIYFNILFEEYYFFLEKKQIPSLDE